MLGLSLTRIGLTGAALVSVLSVAGTAAAAACPAKTDTTLNPVYVTGSSAAGPVVQAIGRALYGLTPRVTLVYKSSESCTGASQTVTGTAITGTSTFVSDGTATPPTCDLGAGVIPDVGVVDVYASSCDVTVPATFQDVLGPIQTMTLSVPAGSPETTLSAEAAKAIFSNGTWTTGGTGTHVDAYFAPNIFIRNMESGTLRMVASAIGLPAASWTANTTAPTSVMTGSGAMATAIKNGPATGTIGILSTNQTDSQRDKIKILAFQPAGASCGYLPDSTAASFDKINVREGRYPVWGPLHFIAPATPSAPIAELLKYVSLDATLSAADKKVVLDAEIGAKVIPQCAMKVVRTGEVGSASVGEQSKAPDSPCGCYFEKGVIGAPLVPEICKSCAADADCSAPNPKCNFGYCEAK